MRKVDIVTDPEKSKNINSHSRGDFKNIVVLSHLDLIYYEQFTGKN